MTSSTSLAREVDGIVEKAMQAWEVTGLALVALQDDQLLISKGYGLREIGTQAKVDEHTLFAIGSNTKPFTATAIGLLVQEGKISWDDPVTQHLPGFALHDATATQNITVRDLLCHRSGLGTWSGDTLLLSNYPTADIIGRIRHIPPGFGFRAGYGYSNLMFVTAGEIIPAVTGLTWGQFVSQRIFEPLGMTDSVTHWRQLRERQNVAAPHEAVDGRIRTVPYREDGNDGAAGSICCSIADMARWLRLHLNEGRLDGRQIVESSILEATRTPHTFISLLPEELKYFPTRHLSAYGLGWFLSDDYGRLVIRHTGGVDGMLSITVLVPQERLALAIFTNKLPNGAYLALAYSVLEKLLGRPPRDWIQTYREVDREARERAQKADQQRREAQAMGTRPALALEEYVGMYRSLILGEATVTKTGSGLSLQLQAHASLSGALSHWHYDTFRCKWDDPVLRESLIPFITDGQGRVTEFRVKIREDWIDPLEHVFRRSDSSAGPTRRGFC